MITANKNLRARAYFFLYWTRAFQRLKIHSLCIRSSVDMAAESNDQGPNQLHRAIAVVHPSNSSRFYRIPSRNERAKSRHETHLQFLILVCNTSNRNLTLTCFKYLESWCLTWPSWTQMRGEMQRGLRSWRRLTLWSAAREVDPYQYQDDQPNYPFLDYAVGWSIAFGGSTGSGFLHSMEQTLMLRTRKGIRLSTLRVPDR